MSDAHRVEHWTTQGLGTPTPSSWNSMYNFWFPQNLTTNSLLLPRSVTHNKQSINIFYPLDILYTRGPQPFQVQALVLLWKSIALWSEVELSWWCYCWGAAGNTEVSRAHPPLTSCCIAWFLTGHRLVSGHGLRVRDPCVILSLSLHCSSLRLSWLRNIRGTSKNFSWFLHSDFKLKVVLSSLKFLYFVSTFLKALATLMLQLFMSFLPHLSLFIFHSVFHVCSPTHSHTFIKYWSE